MTQSSYSRDKHKRIGLSFSLAAAVVLAVTAVVVQPAHTAPHYAWHNSYKAVVDQTAAVVQGTVTSVSESYNEREGPRTLVTLSKLNVLWGEIRSPDVMLKLFGGHVPGHRGRIDEVHIPTFVRGKTYLVFLSNRDWRLSPVTARQAFIIEKVQGKDIVATRDGFAVFGIDDATGPIRKFPVYRMPKNEIDEKFVPPIDTSITPSMVASAYSPTEFVRELKAWAARNNVLVSGTFNDQPYSSTGSWHIIQETAGKSSGREPAEQSETGPSAPDREAVPCWNRPDPSDSDADPKDFSSLCRQGGPQ